MIKGSVFRYKDGYLAMCSCGEWDKIDKDVVEKAVSHYKRIKFKDFSADIVDFSVTRSCFSNSHDVCFQIKSDALISPFDEPQEVTFE